MKQLFALLSIFALTGFGAQAQNGKVTGSVLDGSQKIIESATISLVRAKDTSVVKLSVAGKDGAFSFDRIAYGNYRVLVTAVGHQRGFSPAFELSPTNETMALQALELVPLAKSMGAVTVTSRKPLVEQKIDRTVVNVEASITNVGTNALEVLEKAPGVSVDREGNISLKGKQGVVVLVDGRPTQLGAADLANMLRTMQSSGLDQIEIMTNPPAKYDAAGNAGVINIKTKRNRMMGYNGSVGVTVGYGRHLRTNENASIAFRENKVNLYGNFSHNYGKRTEFLDIQRNFLRKNTNEVVNRFEQEAELINQRNGYNGKIGLDYNFNKNTSVGVSVSGYSGPNTFNGNTVTNDLVAGKVAGVTRSFSGNKETFRNLSNNLNFRRVLDTTGSEITADLDYVVYDGNTATVLNNRYYTSRDVLRGIDTLYGSLPQTIRIYSGKADYVKPLKRGARLEGGLKFSRVNTDNNAQYDTTNNGRLVRDLGRSNHFVYEESINAAYVNLNTPLSKKWNAQLGLRFEQTTAIGQSKGFRFASASGDFVKFDTTFKNKYAQLFPTAYLQYVASEKNSFVLNYGRRIRRPNYESLNPFIEFIDRYTYQQGNPNLKPQFSHNVELSHTYKGFLTTTVNYTNTNNIIQQVIEQNADRSEAYVKQANIAKQQQYGLAVSAGMPLTKWWTNNIYVNVFYNHFEGLVNNAPIDFAYTSMMLNGSQQFKMGKNTTAEMSGFFRTTAVEGVMKIKSLGMINFGMSQQVMKGKGSLRLTVRDVLRTQVFRGEARYSDVDAGFQNYNDSRAVSLGFTYRFSKGKVSGPKRRSSSAADEQSRVGGNGGN